MSSEHENNEAKENPQLTDNKEEIQEKIEALDKEKQIDQNVLGRIYGQDIFKVTKSINDLEEKYTNYFKTVYENLSESYKAFNKEINENIYSNANKLIKAFKLDSNKEAESDKEISALLEKYSSEKISLINKIISNHKIILESIQESVKLLQNYLNISKELDKEKPVQDFLFKEFNAIVKNWMFLKFDLEKFNFSKALSNSDIDQNFREFILKICRGKNFVMNIKLPKINEGDQLRKPTLSPEEDKMRLIKKNEHIRTIAENRVNLVKLKMINVMEVDSYLGRDLQFEKMKNLYLENVSFKNTSLIYQFPYLEKLTIKCCPSFEMAILRNLSTHLSELDLSKNGFVNYEFNEIITNYLVNSQSIRDNLQYLSFANNNITKVELSQLITKPREIFRALKEMDFRKNKIYKFNLNIENFKALKVINCCGNNFNRFNFEDYKDILVLQGGNSFLLDKDYCSQYYSGLEKTISMNAYPISYLNLSYIHKSFSISYISKIKMSSASLSNLKKLNLSYNNLSCGCLFAFIENNKSFTNLKSFNLSGNELDDTFFERYLTLEYVSVFPKLKSLSLNSNQIGKSDVNVSYKDNSPIIDKKNEKDINKLRLMYSFIKQNKYLVNLKITKNPISEFYTVVPEKSGNADKNSNYIKRDKEGNIIINCLFSFLVKIKDELLLGGDEKSGRKGFNIRFDCRSNVNRNSDNYPYSDKPIVFKK